MKNKRNIIIIAITLLLIIAICATVIIINVNKKDSNINIGTSSILNEKYYISSTDYENKEKALVYDKEINYKDLNNSSTYYEISNGTRSITHNVGDEIKVPYINLKSDFIKEVNNKIDKDLEPYYDKLIDYVKVGEEMPNSFMSRITTYYSSSQTNNILSLFIYISDSNSKNSSVKYLTYNIDLENNSYIDSNNVISIIGTNKETITSNVEDYLNDFYTKYDDEDYASYYNKEAVEKDKQKSLNKFKEDLENNKLNCSVSLNKGTYKSCISIFIPIYTVNTGNYIYERQINIYFDQDNNVIKK